MYTPVRFKIGRLITTTLLGTALLIPLIATFAQTTQTQTNETQTNTSQLPKENSGKDCPDADKPLDPSSKEAEPYLDANGWDCYEWRVSLYDALNSDGKPGDAQALQENGCLDGQNCNAPVTPTDGEGGVMPATSDPNDPNYVQPAATDAVEIDETGNAKVPPANVDGTVPESQPAYDKPGELPQQTHPGDNSNQSQTPTIKCIPGLPLCIRDNSTTPPQNENQTPVVDSNGQAQLCTNCVRENITGTKRPNPTSDAYKENLQRVITSLQDKYPGLAATIYSGSQVNPYYDPAKGSRGSGRHANGNGGDLTFSINGQAVTDPYINADIAQQIANVSNGQAGIGYSHRSDRITHVDFEPNPRNGYHGTWGYGGDKPGWLQSAFIEGAAGNVAQGALDPRSLVANQSGNNYGSQPPLVTSGTSGTRVVNNPTASDRYSPIVSTVTGGRSGSSINNPLQTFSSIGNGFGNFVNSSMFGNSGSGGGGSNPFGALFGGGGSSGGGSNSGYNPYQNQNTYQNQIAQSREYSNRLLDSLVAQQRQQLQQFYVTADTSNRSLAQLKTLLQQQRQQLQQFAYQYPDADQNFIRSMDRAMAEYIQAIEQLERVQANAPTQTTSASQVQQQIDKLLADINRLETETESNVNTSVASDLTVTALRANKTLTGEYRFRGSLSRTLQNASDTSAFTEVGNYFGSNVAHELLLDLKCDGTVDEKLRFNTPYYSILPRSDGADVLLSEYLEVPEEGLHCFAFAVDVNNLIPEQNENNNQSQWREFIAGTAAETEGNPTLPPLNFDVAVYNSNYSSIIRDWTDEDIIMSEGQQLVFRWDAPEYQECVPLLSSVTPGSADNTSPIERNTLSENVEIHEHTGYYEIRCSTEGATRVETIHVKVE